MTTSSDTRSNLTSGTVVHGRYRILDVIGASALGTSAHRTSTSRVASGHSTTCLVIDEASGGTGGIMEATRIAMVFSPPEAKGGAQRLDALREAVRVLQEHPHPTRAAVLESFDDERRFWVVMAAARGTALTTLMETRALLTRSEKWRLQVAQRLAGALVSLVALHQANAIAALEPSVINIDASGRVTITDFGFGVFLLGGASPSGNGARAETNLEAMAVRQFGRLMFAILTAENFREAPSKVQDGIHDVVLRCLLASRTDAIQNLDALTTAVKQLISACPNTDLVAPSPSPTESERATAANTEAPPAAEEAASSKAPSAEDEGSRSQPEPAGNALQPVAPAAPTHDEAFPIEPSSKPAAEAEARQSAAIAPAEELRTAVGSTAFRPSTQGDMVGTMLDERFLIVHEVDSPNMWGAVYRVVAQVGDQSVEYIARQHRIPPLRQGLDERLQRVRVSLAEWRDHPHPTRVPIIDSFQQDGSIWVVSERVSGVNIDALASKLDSKRYLEVDPRKASWRAIIGSSLGEALGSLLSLPNAANVIAQLTPRQVVIRPDGTVTIVNPGLGRFLQPRPASELPAAELQALALKRFGEMMYSLLTGDKIDSTGVIVESALPEEFGYLVLRSLSRHRPDAYKTLDELRADLEYYREMVESERGNAPTWDDVVLEPEAVPWTRRFLPPFVHRAAAAAHELLAAHPMLVRGAYALAFGLVLTLIFQRLHRSAMVPHFTAIKGPALYVTEADGTVEVVDVDEKHSAGALQFGGPVTGIIFSVKWQTAYLAIPSQHQVAALDVARGEVNTRDFADDPPQQLYKAPGETVAMGVGTAPQLSTLILQTLGLKSPVPLPDHPSDVVFVPRANNSIAYLAGNQDRIVLFNLNTRRIVTSVHLAVPARGLRLDADGKKLWVLSLEESGKLPILDATTLKPVATLELGEPALDVAFESGAYVLLEKSSQVAIVSGPDFKIQEKRLTGLPNARRILIPTPDELWFLGQASNLEVHTLSSDAVRRVTLQNPPLDCVIARPF